MPQCIWETLLGEASKPEIGNINCWRSRISKSFPTQIIKRIARGSNFFRNFPCRRYPSRSEWINGIICMCNCAGDVMRTPRRLFFTISEIKGFFDSMLPSISSRRSLKISLARNERELPSFLRLIKARCHLWKMVWDDSINEIDCRFFTIRSRLCSGPQHDGTSCHHNWERNKIWRRSIMLAF